MILINKTAAIGDCLRSFTATIKLVNHFKSQGQIVYVGFASAVGELFPYDRLGAKRLSDLTAQDSTFEREEKVYCISWNAQTLGRSPLRNDVDFNAAISDYFHIDVAALQDYGEDGPELQVEVPPSDDDFAVPIANFVIAPYALNNWPHKCMTPQFWQELIDKLPSGSVVIGSTKLPSDEELRSIEPSIERFKGEEFLKYNFTPYLHNCSYFLDRSFIEVAQLINKMEKCMISIDSGPSHLINKLRKPHIEFHPHQNVMISKFSKFNERTELGRPITPDDVIERIGLMF